MSSGCDRQRANSEGWSPPNSPRTVPLDCTVAVAVRLGLGCVTTLATARGWICLIPHSLLCFSGEAVAMGPFGFAAAALVAAGHCLSSKASHANSFGGV